MPPDGPTLTSPTMPTPTPMPRLPDHDFTGASHGISLLSGWLPTVIEVVTVTILVVVIGWRTWRWRLVWLPVSAVFGVLAALAARGYIDSEALASDPVPLHFLFWIGLCASAVAVAVLGFKRVSWWRRGLSLVAIGATGLCAVVVLNQWVGYYPTVQLAWADFTAGPLPDQIDAQELPKLRNTHLSTGKLVPVDIPDHLSGFKHRREYVYLPPIWFAGTVAPKLPAVMMIAAEFNNPTNWIRVGNAVEVIDRYAHEHGGAAPVLVFPDTSGRFNNDTECVNGPRGNTADHLTKEVRPYVISQFGSSSDPAQWGAVGWSSGGTCAIDLVVMHPDLFATFQDIGGDRGPNAGDKQRTIDRLYGGDASAWEAFDPRTVMAKHGPYHGVAGYFDDSEDPAKSTPDYKYFYGEAPVGFGGRGDDGQWREEGAVPELCAAAVAVDIECSLHVYVGWHTWQFAAQAFSDALPWLAQRVRTPSAMHG